MPDSGVLVDDVCGSEAALGDASAASDYNVIDRKMYVRARAACHLAFRLRPEPIRGVPLGTSCCVSGLFASAKQDFEITGELLSEAGAYREGLA